ncbi:MAG: hypothetical protein ABI645_17490 [Pseudomonadota bacterium]
MATNKTASGFVLPVVLGIVLIAALIAIQSATELGNTTLLATQRQLHQRAFEAAESGIVAVLDQFGSAEEPATVQTLRTNGTPDSALVQTIVTSRNTLPDGFSVDRIAETHYEIRSTGRSLRGSDVTAVQGVRKLHLAVEP